MTRLDVLVCRTTVLDSVTRMHAATLEQTPAPYDDEEEAEEADAAGPCPDA